MRERVLKHIKDRYGSKRGLLNHVKYRVLLQLGLYNKYRNIDFSKITRLVFICSGNICRSSLAEIVASSLGANAVSYGLHCRGGDPADPRAIDFAGRHNLDLSKHITTNIRDYVYQPGDLILGMEPKHIEELEVCEIPPSSISAIGLWMAKPRVYIHDPYNSSTVFFDACEEQIVNAVESIIAKQQR